jgi:hypothetical protein
MTNPQANPQPDPAAIRETYRWLAHAPHGVSEVRVIAKGRGVLGIGFFDDEDAFVAECVRHNNAGNVYVGIQPRPRRLMDLARNAIRPIRSGGKKADIETVTATVIDLDPAREANTAATEDELALALAAGEKAADWCEAQGLVTQLWCALPAINLTPENTDTVTAGLKAFEENIRQEVETKAVHVDSIHDLPRIINLRSVLIGPAGRWVE